MVKGEALLFLAGHFFSGKKEFSIKLLPDFSHNWKEAMS